MTDVLVPLLSESVQVKILPTWNSKHNRYCGGLLIRSRVVSRVQVRVLLIPPNDKELSYGDQQQRIYLLPQMRGQDQDQGHPEGDGAEAFSPLVSLV